MKARMATVALLLLLATPSLAAEPSIYTVNVPLIQDLDKITDLQVQLPNTFRELKTDQARGVSEFIPEYESADSWSEKIEIRIFPKIRANAIEYVQSVQKELQKKYAPVTIIDQKNDVFRNYKTSLLVLNFDQNQQSQALAIKCFSSIDNVACVYHQKKLKPNENIATELAKMKTFLQDKLQLNTQVNGELQVKNSATGKTERDFIRTALISTTNDQRIVIEGKLAEAEKNNNRENQVFYIQMLAYFDVKLNCLKASKQTFVFESSCMKDIEKLAQTNNYVAQATMAQMYENLLGDRKNARVWFEKVLGNPTASEAMKTSIEEQIKRLDREAQ